MKLLENNNRKFIKTLSVSCLKADKGRNKIAALAIALTAVLFMALATVLEGARVTEKNQKLRQVGTKLMVSIKNLTEEEAKKVAAAPEFTVSAVERYAVNVVNPQLKNMQAAAGWVDETSAKYSFMELEQGRYPKEDDELACDTEVLRLLGLPCELGSRFVMQYTAGDTVYEKQMTVCGFWKGMKYEQRASLLVSEAFVDQAMECYDGDYAPLKEMGYDVWGNFAKEKDVAGQLDRMLKRLGYDPVAKRGEEGFVIHHVNPVYAAQSQDDIETLAMAGFGAALILLAGYLIIYNIFKISIEKDIRLYGQLKTVGASPKQLRYLVVRQAAALCAAGIPAGLILGWLLGNALLPLVMANTSFQEASFIVPSVWIWLLSAFFTFLTVRISCARPARIAGKISPVEALRYQGIFQSGKKSKKGGQSAHRIASMAVSNLGRNKGKTALVALSIAFSAILLNCTLNYSESMDKETFVRREAIADFDVRSEDYLKYSMEDYHKTVPKETAEALNGMDAAERFGWIYCRMLPQNELVNGFEDTGSVTRINGKETPDDVVEFDRARMLYGMNEQALLGVRVVEGKIDYEKLCSGDYVVMAGFLSDKGEYFYESQEFHAGDVIELEIDGKAKEYTVMAVAGLASSQCMCYSKGGYESVVFAKPVFSKLFPDMEDPIHCLFYAKEGQFDKLNAQMEAFAAQRGVTVLTRLTAEEEFKEMQRTYSMGGIIVAVILGAIGILNLVNVIFTGVIARRREFASMRSIGMTAKQLKKLVIYEGIMYAAIAGGVAMILSGILSVSFVKHLTAGMWFMKYRFTVLPAAVACLACLVLSVCVSAGTDRMWNRGSIVERLRDC